MTHCPTCGARRVEGLSCHRCQTDLRQVLAIEQAAVCCRRRASAALERGCRKEARVLSDRACAPPPVPCLRCHARRGRARRWRVRPDAPAVAGDSGRAGNVTPNSMNEACLSGCHPHPLYVWCGDKWLGRRTKRGWMFCSGKTFRFRGRFLSSSDFSRMTRPVPPIWRRRGGVTGSSAPIARRRQSRSASPAGPASCAAGSAAATPG